jgi:hypothetical protein
MLFSSSAGTVQRLRVRHPLEILLPCSGASLMFAFKYEVYFASDVTATATVSVLVLRLRNFSTPALRFELWIRKKKLWF